jgi:hypothetical protein
MWLDISMNLTERETYSNPVRNVRKLQRNPLPVGVEFNQHAPLPDRGEEESRNTRAQTELPMKE